MLTSLGLTCKVSECYPTAECSLFVLFWDVIASLLSAFLSRQHKNVDLDRKKTIEWPAGFPDVGLSSLSLFSCESNKGCTDPLYSLS